MGLLLGLVGCDGQGVIQRDGGVDGATDADRDAGGGKDDPNFSWSAVQNEADVFAGLGYQTRFQMVQACGHYINENLHHTRSDAWNWVSDFNLQN